MLETRRLIAAGGLAAVTHRAVEAAAGAPHGTVTYWFGNREGLLAALVESLLEECAVTVRAIAAPLRAHLEAGEAYDADLIAAGIEAWIDQARDLHIARLELELQAARDPLLRERMTEAARVFWQMCEPLAAATGSDDPVRDGRAIAAMIDGLLVDRLSHAPQDHAVVVAAVQRLLAPAPWTAAAPDAAGRRPATA